MGLTWVYLANNWWIEFGEAKLYCSFKLHYFSLFLGRQLGYLMGSSPQF